MHGKLNGPLLLHIRTSVYTFSPRFVQACIESGKLGNENMLANLWRAWYEWREEGLEANKARLTTRTLAVGQDLFLSWNIHNAIANIILYSTYHDRPSLSLVPLLDVTRPGDEGDLEELGEVEDDGDGDDGTDVRGHASPRVDPVHVVVVLHGAPHGAVPGERKRPKLRSEAS